MMSSPDRLLALTAAALLGSAALQAQSPASSSPTIYRADEILVAPGVSLEGADARMLVRDGKIVAIGSDVPATPPAGTKVESFDGHVIAAGFVLPHHHLSRTQDLAETIDAFTPHLRTSDAFDPFDDRLHELAKSGVTSIGLAPVSSNTFPGRAAAIRTGVEGELLGQSWLKLAFVQESLNQQRYPTSRMGAADLVRGAFADAANPLGVQSLELLTIRAVLRGEIPLAIHARTRTEMTIALQLAEELQITPLLLEAGTIGDEIERIRGRGVSVVLPPLTFSSDEDALALPKKLADADVPFSFLAQDGMQLRRSLHLAMRNGLTAEQAHAVATTIPAGQIGVGETAGVLRAGRSADFTVFRGHPLELTSSMVHTFVGGNVVPEEKPSKEGLAR